MRWYPILTTDPADRRMHAYSYAAQELLPAVRHVVRAERRLAVMEQHAAFGPAVRGVPGVRAAVRADGR